MRIALVSPLHESVPPRLYGGTERVVSFLAESLVRMGHDVTLFASGDSRTRAKLRSMAPRGLRLDPSCRDPVPHHVAMVDAVAESAHEFDVIHFHTDWLHFPTVRQCGMNAVTTLHGRLDLPELAPLFARFGDLAMVSVSESQRRALPGAGWIATVHHGLPRELFAPGAGRGGYLAFVGRISPEKRLDRAIRIARRAGVPLRIAAKVEKLDLTYYEEVVKPMMSGPGVEFVGEIGEHEKSEFLGGAIATLFPIDWPEPFGLVMIESMACGTPVVAWPCGSVPEVVDEGVTGRVVRDEDEAVRALDGVAALDRGAVRARFEERFTAERMAGEYVQAYRRVCGAPTLSPVRSAA